MNIVKNWILSFGIKKLAIISTVAVVGVTGTTVAITSVKKSENAVVEEEKILINTQGEEDKEVEEKEVKETTDEEVVNQEVVTETTPEELEAETVKEQTTTNATTSNNSSSGNTTTNSNSSTTNKVTTSNGSTNITTGAQTTTPTYERFTYSIGVYETKNLPSEDSYYDDRCPAWIGVYSVGKDNEIQEEIKERFRAEFGYTANSEVACTCIGTYYVEGYDTAKDVYQYTIKDLTYPLLTDEFYVITKQLCADGSAWVGFPVPGNLDTMDTSSRVSDLLNEMNRQFCEWTGYSMEYIQSNRDKFMVNMISVAGKMRTTDGQVLDVVYRYTRGLNMPINAE